jgi:AcrR family transcriptional regulator
MAAGSVRNRTGAADEAGIVQRPEPIGRGDRARQRVLTAALDQLADGGSAGFTMEAIARRAGASKATLYRHWPSAPALLVEAMGGTFPPFPPPATGDLRSDLVTLLTDLAALLDGPRFPRLMAAIIDLAERDPALADLHADLTAAHRRPALEVLRHGQHEEQIPPGADLELLLDQLTAPFFYRRLIAHRAIPPSMAEAIVDQSLALHRGRPAAGATDQPRTLNRAPHKPTVPSPPQR